MALHFLQANDVGVLDLSGDAREVIPVVLAETVLNVIGDEFHPGGKVEGVTGLVKRLTDFSMCSRFIDFVSCQRQVRELFSGTRVSQLQHAAVRRQNQLFFWQVAQSFISAHYQGFNAFNFVLTDINHAQHDRFLADSAQYGSIQLARRPL